MGGGVGRGCGIGESMGNESNKVMIGFALQHPASGQPSRSICPSLWSDLMKEKAETDLSHSAIVEILLRSHTAPGSCI